MKMNISVIRLQKAKQFFLYVLVSTSMLLVVPKLPVIAQVPGKCTASNLGSASGSFTVPVAGTYRIWSSMMPSSTNTANNSYSLELDGTQCIQNIGDATIPANTWTWVDYKDGNSGSKINVTLAAGNHTYTAYGREAGVKLDKIIFASDLACKPSGNGSNCIPTDPVVVTKPDLVVTAVSMSPTSAKAGDNITFSATIKNQGTAATPKDVIHGVSFDINGSQVSWSDNYKQSIAVGQSVTVTANGGPTGSAVWKVPAAGSYALSATVDDINRITNESNETNNVLSSTVTFTVATSPVVPANPVTPTDVTPPIIVQSFRNLSTPLSQEPVKTVSFLEYQPTATDAGGIRTFTHKVNGINVSLTSGIYTTDKVNGNYTFESTAIDNAGLTTIVQKSIKLRYPDLDRSGKVNQLDMLKVLRKFNSDKNEDVLQGDFNGNNKIDQYDILFMLRSMR